MATKEILKCTSCGNYTLQKTCKCGESAISPKPARWSPNDKYSKYRLQYKKKHL